MHIEAYRFSAGDAAKYEKWFAEYAFNIFIPLFMKLPGIKGYDHYKDTGIRIAQAFREKDYPAYMSIAYLDNLEAFRNYEKSPELANFRKNLKNVFPDGKGYQWWVQYQLIKNWRKDMSPQS